MLENKRPTLLRGEVGWDWGFNGGARVDGWYGMVRPEFWYEYLHSQAWFLHLKFTSAFDADSGLHYTAVR